MADRDLERTLGRVGLLQRWSTPEQFGHAFLTSGSALAGFGLGVLGANLA